MITTFLKWSPDISKAPRGENVTTTRTILQKGKPVEQRVTEFVPTKLLVLTKCGKVTSTYWIPSREASGGAVLGGNRWSGLATGEEPVLWAPWPDAAELAELHALGVFDDEPGEIRLGDLLAHAECDA